MKVVARGVPRTSVVERLALNFNVVAKEAVIG